MAKNNIKFTDVQVVVHDTKTKQKDVKKNVKPTKVKKERKPLGKRLKETFAELKKVSWPTFGKVVKQTLVVIALVALCTLVLLGVDKLLSLLYSLIQ